MPGIFVISLSGQDTTNMFANTNIDFVELINWSSYVKCNDCKRMNDTIVNPTTKTSTISKKMLQAQMIKNRKRISYHNSNRQNIYDTIFTHNFYSNAKLITNCNYLSYSNQIAVLLRSNNVSNEVKYKIREFISRIKIIYN
jgi:hypothetical protein|tara:strand:- start:2267 stop:2689 length:423 start_codon:yes stop_codon:yes gene_type:complete